jgi:hypothetical protein
MKVQASFGLVTGCHAGDKFMVQATLASMRHYCPDVPVCLTVDGDVDVSDLQKEYNLIVLRISDLPSAQMRGLIAGGFRAKLAAMWEGPFEFYVWMDSDAIAWGDFTSKVRPDLDFQIFWSEISIPADASEIPSWLPRYYFDVEKLRHFDAEFEWRGNAYFSAGAYASRRNAIPFKQWLEVESWIEQKPGIFSDFGDMGPLNYLVHAKWQRGVLKVETTDLQHIYGHHGVAELEQDCIGANWHFPKEIRRPRVAHFCGRKPCLFDRKAYSRPFTIARLEHFRRHHADVIAWLAILNEDRQVVFGKVKRRIRRLIQKQNQKPLAKIKELPT